MGSADRSAGGLLARSRQRLCTHIRPGVPLSLDDAHRIVGEYIEHYNTVRLHSSIGYVAPANKLEDRDQEIFKERDRKLEEARELRKKKRKKQLPEISSTGEVDSL